MSEQPRGIVAAIIPAYNEARTIRQLVIDVSPHVDLVIVVDDASTDSTLGELRELPVIVLKNRDNLGKGGSLWRGMRHAIENGATKLVTLDGDGQHRPGDIPRLLAAAHQMGDHAIIIGARLEQRENAPGARLFANHFADFWVAWAAGQPIVDSQSGFRCYPAKLIREIEIPHQRDRSFVFESEILIVAGRLDYRIASVPIPSLYPENARHSHMRPGIDITRIVFMVAWKLFTRAMYPQGLWRSLRQQANIIKA